MGEAARPLDGFVEAIVEQISARVLEAVNQRLDAMAAPQSSKNALDKHQLAKRLGVSVSTVDRMAHDGMPHFYAGTHRRFDHATCKAWLEERGKAPARKDANKKSTAATNDMGKTRVKTRGE